MDSVTGEIIKEQSTIEVLADKHRKMMVAWVASQKRYMKSIDDLSYTEWRALILRKAKDDLGSIGATMLSEVLNGAYHINKSTMTGITWINKADSLAAAAASKTTGQTAEQGIKQLMNSTYGTLVTETTRYNAQNLTTVAVTDAIMGSASQLYKNGDMVRWINGSRTWSTTYSKSSLETIRQARYSEDSDVIGYQWVSVLDSRTSDTCMGLSGKKFYFGTSGYKPLPPIHPNCRSTTVPIIKDTPQPDLETFSEWAANNPDELEEALGPTKFELYESGQLSITKFTDARFKPMTIPEIEDQL